MEKLKWIALVAAAFSLFGCKGGNRPSASQKQKKQPVEEAIQTNQPTSPTIKQQIPEKPDTQRLNAVKGPDYEKRAAKIREFRARFADNIRFESEAARDLVTRYRINCQLPDNRQIPIMHVLYLSAGQMTVHHVDKFFTVQNTGRNVRIYASTYRDGKQLTPPKLQFSINEMNRWTVYGFSPAAVMNTCFSNLVTYPGESF